MDITLYNRLPDEILEYILDKVLPLYKYNLSKNFYIKYHYLISSKISNYDNYIRNIIRHDCNYVFDFLLNENFINWLNVKKIYYEGFIITNYIRYLNYLIDKHNSDRCKAILINKLKDNDLYKNWHKKNGIKNIKWKV